MIIRMTSQGPIRDLQGEGLKISLDPEELFSEVYAGIDEARMIQLTQPLWHHPAVFAKPPLWISYDLGHVPQRERDLLVPLYEALTGTIPKQLQKLPDCDKVTLRSFTRIDGIAWDWDDTATLIGFFLLPQHRTAEFRIEPEVAIIDMGIAVYVHPHGREARLYPMDSLPR